MDGSEVFVCLTTVETFWRVFFFIGSITLFFLIPFFILLVLYSVIAKHLMNNPGIISYGHRSNVLKYRKQVIFMLAAVVISFFVCLLPFRGLTLWIIIAPAEDILALGVEKYYNILYFSRIMLYLNSAMNPILYNLMSSKFREGFFRLLGCRSFVVRKKFTHGVHKGTFHTTSTNLSSSQSNDRRVHHHQGAYGGGGSIIYNGHGSFSSSSNRKRLSETLDDSCQLPSEYLIENSFAGSNGKYHQANGRKKNNFIIKKCLVESTVINAIAHEPVANKDLSRKLKENFSEPCSEFTSEIESLMEDDEQGGRRDSVVMGTGEDHVVVNRRNSRGLMVRRSSRQLEFNNNAREAGCPADVIVVLLKKPVITSPIHEESNSLDDADVPPDSKQRDGGTGDGEIYVAQGDTKGDGQECSAAVDVEEGHRQQPWEAEEEEHESNGDVRYNFSEVVFLTAKESEV